MSPASFALALGGGIALFLAIYFIILFNNLVMLKNNVVKAWANIDVLLKQRHDELPKLIDTCKHYMQFEQATLEKITAQRGLATQARAQGDVATLNKAESLLKSSLGNLFALAENYPDLKTNQTFIQLQSRISQLENSIADRRELYNDSVTLNNIRLEQFPDNMVAKIAGFKRFVPLEFAQENMADININQAFKA